MATISSIPAFIVPTLQRASLAPARTAAHIIVSSAMPRTTANSRCFSATPSLASKIGRSPLLIPDTVSITIGDIVSRDNPLSYLPIETRTVTVTGPLGTMELKMPPYIQIIHDTDTRVATLSVDDTLMKRQREMWGTTWAFLNRAVRGVSEGHTAVLRLVGIGYRASIESHPEREEYPGQQFVVMKLGFSHTVEMGVPLGINASTPQPTRIVLEGVDIEAIHSFAAKIRDWRRPEPYKGKGIFVNDETIKLKQKKIK